MKGVAYNIMYVIFIGLIAAATFAGMRTFLLSGVIDTSIRLQADVAKLNGADISCIADACLKGGEDAISITRLQALAGSDLKEACRTSIMFGVMVEDLESPEKWNLPCDGCKLSASPITTTIKVGDDIHLGRLSVIFQG